MKFSIESEELKEALESLQVRGKHLSGSGFTNSTIGQYAYLSLSENQLTLYNGDATFIVSITLEVTGTKDGQVVLDSHTVLPYLKSFSGPVAFTVNDFISVSSGSKKASIPLVVNHPNETVLERAKNLLNHVSYQPQPETLFTFGKSKFEGAFTLPQRVFQDCLRNCELVKSGVYKLDYNDNLSTFSTRTNVQNKYSETIEPMFNLGESGTIEFSGPLYAFFKKDQLLNFYSKDEFPLLIVSDDRMLLKAPYINGE